MNTTLTDLQQMARYLAGDFNNQEQAWENPPFYAQIQVCYYPLPWSVFQNFGFYVEQAYVGHLETPYRIAVVELTYQGSQILMRNYRPQAPERWQGSAHKHPDQLQQMTLADLSYLPGCDVIMRQEGGIFKGESEPGQACCVVRQGKSTYLKTTVYLSEHEFHSHDQGFDPETHEQVWGALAGPFRFRKTRDLAAWLPLPHFAT